MREIITKAVQIYRNNPASDDSEIYQRLMAEITDPNIATQLFDLLPLAYARALLVDSDANFSESYQRIDKYGHLSPEQPLASIPIWNEIVKYAQSEIEKGITIKDLLAIAYSSSEYKAIMNMKQKGYTISDCTFLPPIFIDPGANPKDIARVLQTHGQKIKSSNKKWWQFWR
jgi:antirestriction protein